jgi:copper oxidase (laccase) domain-containing protein
MMNELGCLANNIKVIMGPSIHTCCYEVSDELVNIVKTSFGEKFCKGNNIDLHGINVKLLEEVGIRHIRISDICTKCSNEPFYSFRKNPKTGRFAGIIKLSINQ